MRTTGTTSQQKNVVGEGTGMGEGFILDETPVLGSAAKKYVEKNSKKFKLARSKGGSTRTRVYIWYKLDKKK